MIIPHTFILDAARANGEEVNAPGTGLFVATRVPLGAYVKLDSRDAPPIYIFEGDEIRSPFARFYLYHPYEDGGILRLHILTAGDTLVRPQTPSVKRRGNIAIAGTSTAGKQWTAQLYNKTVLGVNARLCRLSKVQFATETAGVQAVNLLIATPAWVQTGGSALFNGSYLDTRIPVAETGPLGGEFVDRAVPSASFSITKTIDPANGVWFAEFDVEWVLHPGWSVRLWVYPGASIIGRASAQYTDEG